MIRYIFVLLIMALITFQPARNEQEKRNLSDQQSQQWQEFLNTIPVGSSLEKVKEELARGSNPVGFIWLGGSGNVEWVFQIDSKSEVASMFDRHDKLVEPLRFQARRDFRRFPDGSIVPE